MKRPSRVRSNAHFALAGIRFVMGSMALLVPRSQVERLEIDADASPALLYFQRMFGIRTVLIALDLVTGDEEDRRRALRRSPMIHASDATAAALAGRSGNLPPGAARTTVAISLVNLVLALIARPHPVKGLRGLPFGIGRP